MLWKSYFIFVIAVVCLIINVVIIGFMLPMLVSAPSWIAVSLGIVVFLLTVAFNLFVISKITANVTTLLKRK